MKVSVILATYKEKENIAKLISAILNAFRHEKNVCEIIVVDDNSPDGTAEAVRKAYGRNKKVRLIVRKDEKGLGTAVRRGVEESKGDAIVFMDSDFSHDPNQIPEMARLVDKHGIVSGSRYEKGGGIETSFYRKMATKMMKLYMNVILRLNIKDYTNGFFIVKRSVLEKLDYERIFYGYGDYYFRLYYYASKKGIKIKEIPTHYKFREEGVSKTNIIKHGWQYITSALKLRLGI